MIILKTLDFDIIIKVTVSVRFSHHTSTKTRFTSMPSLCSCCRKSVLLYENLSEITKTLSLQHRFYYSVVINVCTVVSSRLSSLAGTAGDKVGGFQRWAGAECHSEAAPAACRTTRYDPLCR